MFAPRNHPKSLRILFFTEMWERFSYYGMRALLVLYAVKHLHFSDGEAGRLYGTYTGFVYITPILGGWIADRWLGIRVSIYGGGLLMALGHMVLAIDSLWTFYGGLILLVLGNGLFKPNMSNLVGQLYRDRPEQKDSGYTIFYMGINLGGFLGPIVCGYLGEGLGWHYGFGASGLGMAVGLVVFASGQKILSLDWKQNGDPEPKSSAVQPHRDNPGFRSGSSADSELPMARIKTILVLSFFSIFFWTAFEQAGSSMNLFADRYVDRNLGFLGEIPASVFQSVNPIFILVLAPFFAQIWVFLGRKHENLDPSPATKFCLGLLFLALGFVVLVYSAWEVDRWGKTAAFWLVLAYFLNTCGELCLSPVGLSMVSKMAPPQWMGLFMGIWFLSNSVSHILGGFVSGYFEIWGSMVFFGLFVVLALFAAAILYLVRNRLNFP